MQPPSGLTRIKPALPLALAATLASCGKESPKQKPEAGPTCHSEGPTKSPTPSTTDSSFKEGLRLEPQPDRGSCTGIKKITVAGKNFAELKKLVVDVMLGNPSDPNDGLQEIVEGMTQNAPGKPPMAVQTVAVKKWIDAQPERYNRLGDFGLQPTVGECRTSQPICDMTTDAKGPASPDLYLNLVQVLDALNSPTGSISYFIYDQTRQTCPFFGLHRGALAFTLEGSCSSM